MTDSDPLSGLDAARLLGAAVDPAHAADPGTAATSPAVGALAPLFPNYEILGSLGRGGTSAVYRARHRKFERDVAIKVLLPEIGGDSGFAERFRREARMTARLDHPFIVTVHDYGDVEGVFYLVLELCSGRTFRDLIQEGEDGRRRALAMMPKVCDAVRAAHRAGTVHRDLKPENVLIDRHGFPRVADFGLAKLSTPGVTRMTMTGDVLGTPHYMAPEQIAGSGVDERTDSYSLAVMLYELLTGTLPVGRFEAPSKRGAWRSDLDDVVMSALSQNPSQRASVEQLIAALEAPPPSSGFSMPSSSEIRKRRRGESRDMEGPAVALVAAIVLPIALTIAIVFESTFPLGAGVLGLSVWFYSRNEAQIDRRLRDRQMRKKAKRK